MFDFVDDAYRPEAVSGILLASRRTQRRRLVIASGNLGLREEYTRHLAEQNFASARSSLILAPQLTQTLELMVQVYQLLRINGGK